MRRFVFVSHTGDATGDWGLDDLAGSTGRVDVLCRNIQAAMFLSHGLRDDTDVYLSFVDSDRPTCIHLEGAKVQRLNPDERSTAARIRSALKARPQDDWWEEVEPGIHSAPFTLAELAHEIRGTPVLLHKEGSPLASADIPSEPAFILGDHQPLTDNELALWPDATRVSLGDKWYHGNHATAVVQHHLDQEVTHG